MSASPLFRQLVGRSAVLVPFLEDPTVTDILINGVQSLYIEREDGLKSEPSPFSSAEALFDFIERLTVPIGKRVDAAHPYLDGRLLDGSRFHVILPPIAPEGPLISIRKFRPVSPEAMLAAFGPKAVMGWLRDQVQLRRNILIAGGTGSGKTSLLSCLIGEISPSERIAIVEESIEIRPCHPHTFHLEARAKSPDGTGEVTLRALLKNTLRMRPDRIILGECRGEEAFDLVQALNTGHSGSLSTLHSNGARDALRRLESLVLLAGFAIPLKIIREWIGSAVDVVVHLERRGNMRRVKEITLVHGVEGEVYRFTPYYEAD